MSIRYLGEEFDIHGGGMDLIFPHHEAEIAQSVAAQGHEAAHYWMHNNMITINGQKMGKSLGNFITLNEFFTGKHAMLTQAYSPMTIRFFILQAHYRGTVDFSNEALQAAEKGLLRLLKGVETLDKLSASTDSTFDVAELRNKCYAAMDDDMNTPVLIAQLFEGVKYINSAAAGTEHINADSLSELKKLFKVFVFDILGLLPEKEESSASDRTAGLINLLLGMRQEAKQTKNWAMADKIRNELIAMGVTIRDTKDGFEWEMD